MLFIYLTYNHLHIYLDLCTFNLGGLFKVRNECLEQFVMEPFFSAFLR